MKLGIDPGTVNIGVAVTNDDGALLFSTVLNCHELGGIDKVVAEILSICDTYKVNTCSIERFVPYKNIFSNSAEEILMIIGAVWYGLKLRGIQLHLLRAIQWKPALCKYMVKTNGFSNPSTSFDKKYSLAVAEAITKTKIKTTHEADAIGLSFMWKVYENK